MPGPASKLYAQNIVNLVTLMTTKDDEGNGVFAPDFDDEIVVRQLRHPRRRDRPRADPRGDRGPPRPTAGAPSRSAHDDAEPTTHAPTPDEQLDLPYDQEADQ